MKRRTFLKTSSALAATVAVPSAIFSGIAKAAPSDRVNIGYIACGRRANQLKPLPENAKVVAAADCNIARAEAMAKKYGGDAYQDYRKMLERSDLDGVIISSPDHWHTLHTVHACQAGKDIYCEKPINLTIREGQLQVKAVRHHKRIFQAGSQQRSCPIDTVACRLVREGRFGKISKVVGSNYQSPWLCKFPAQPCPKELNWDMWCGQTEVRPYHKDIYIPRANPGWISFKPYSGGEVTGWGAHGLDQIQWALGMDETGPVEIWMEPEPKYHIVEFTEPHTREWGNEHDPNPCVHYRYANGVEVVLSDPVRRAGGTFYGSKGEIFIARMKAVPKPETLGQPELTGVKRHNNTEAHLKNWVDCIVSREEPNAPIEVAHRATTACHLVNIARWLGRKVHWDPKTETFPNDPEAAALMERPQRAGYEIPVVG